jgi:hypothetical protein
LLLYCRAESNVSYAVVPRRISKMWVDAAIVSVID